VRGALEQQQTRLHQDSSEKIAEFVGMLVCSRGKWHKRIVKSFYLPVGLEIAKEWGNS
jgi:hypothetical protein